MPGCGAVLTLASLELSRRIHGSPGPGSRLHCGAGRVPQRSEKAMKADGKQFKKTALLARS